MNRMTIAAVMAVSVAAVGLPAKALTFPDRGRAGVVDAAHILQAGELDTLGRKVVAWDQATGHQLVVVTVPNLQGADVKDFGYQLGRAWGLGDKQRNDGAILLLAMAEHKVRIEVGYGLEPVLTDALTSVILQERVVPRLREGDLVNALNDGADAIMAAAKPDPAPPARATDLTQRKAASGWAWFWLLLVAAVSFTGAASALRLRAIRVRRQAAETEKRRRQEVVARRQQEAMRRGRELQADLMASAASVVAKRQSGYSGVAKTSPASAPPRPSKPSAAPAASSFRAVDAPSPSYSSSQANSYSSDDSSSSSGSSWGVGSSDTSSSSSGFDGGGGSFGGGGSDSSW